MNYIKLIKQHRPFNEEERLTIKAMLTFIENHKNNVLSRDNLIGHMTASSVIVNQDISKMLMIHHKIYDTWTWQGGHADGCDNMLEVALKEAREETGLSEFKVMTNHGEPIMKMDILPVYSHVKRGAFVPTHLHLNVAFVFQVDEENMLEVNAEETNGVQWINIDEVTTYAAEPEISPIYHQLIELAKGVFHS